MIDYQLFHFLRPLWFIAIIPAIGLTILLMFYTSKNNIWNKYCDPHLLKHITIGKSRKFNFIIPLFFLSIWILAIIALAGPTWSYKKLPVYQKSVSRVIALDVSNSMNATDVHPTRLQKAKYKLLDLLKDIKEGEVGMVVFSKYPFVVSPLTSDAKTIAKMIPSLSSNIVPVQGHNISKALEKSANLIEQANSKTGQIILVTDSVPTNLDYETAKNIAKKGITISVFAIGTQKGGLVKSSNGTYLKDKKGNISFFDIDLNKLKKLAQAGNGKLIILKNNNSDIKQILKIKNDNKQLSKSKGNESQILWFDNGYYFIWIILIIFVFLFRKGVLNKLC